MNAKERAALRALFDALPPGPWKGNGAHWTWDATGKAVPEEAMHGDAIAASRTAVPALLDRVEALEKALRSFMVAILFDDGPHAGEVGIRSWTDLEIAAHRASALLAPPAGTDKGEP
jgi:hypothetical protein